MIRTRKHGRVSRAPWPEARPGFESRDMDFVPGLPHVILSSRGTWISYLDYTACYLTSRGPLIRTRITACDSIEPRALDSHKDCHIRGTEEKLACSASRSTAASVTLRGALSASPLTCATSTVSQKEPPLHPSQPTTLSMKCHIRVRFEDFAPEAHSEKSESLTAETQ